MDKFESFHFDEALRSSNPNPDVKECQPQRAPGKWDVIDTELEQVEFAKELSLEYQRLSSENSASSDHAAVAAAAWPTPHQLKPPSQLRNSMANSSGKSRFEATRTAQPTKTAQRHSARRNGPGFWPGGDPPEVWSPCSVCEIDLPSGCFGDWMDTVKAVNAAPVQHKKYQKRQCDACFAIFSPTSHSDMCASDFAFEKPWQQQPNTSHCI